MTIESMLRLIGGFFVAVSVLLGMYVHPYFFWFTLFVGLNLFQSGFTGWCPMVAILRRLGVHDTRAAA
jgi:predicted CDP-diglyceride synthetase/phosphatidate cytidylyltransferase